MLNNYKKLRRVNEARGFTLVEMMVAIAVFSIVMVTAMSALLNVIDANNKARSLKTAINNVSFALEGISKDMRMGTEYACGNDNDPAGSCNNGGNIIKYRSNRADYDSLSKKFKFAYYKYNNVNKRLETCLEKNNIICNYSTGPYSAITSNEVKLTNVKFYILNVESLDDTNTQPRMIMTVSGEAGEKEKIKTQFDLQTGVSQINRP